MKRLANSSLSSSGNVVLLQYRRTLWEHEDLIDASRRNSLSDLSQFATRYEAHLTQETNETSSPQMIFAPQVPTMPMLTRYHIYLPKGLHQKPNSVNRALINVKRNCDWVMQKRLISYNPSAPVKLVGEEGHAPSHLEDAEFVPLYRLAQIMGITHWIQLGFIFKGRSMICNRLSKPSHGHKR